MRTTVDIDDPILHEVKALQEREGRSLGSLVSELLADALAKRRAGRPRAVFRWTSRPMKALVDLTDKDAVLLFASDRTSDRHAVARDFLDSCAGSPEVLCLTWPTIMAYLRIATHPSIFAAPLCGDPLPERRTHHVLERPRPAQVRGARCKGPVRLSP